MIKLVVLDMDGVLVDARDLHYKSLNRALKDGGIPEISREEHLSRFDGLPTSKKLEMLCEDGFIVKDSIEWFWNLKQRYTTDIVDAEFFEDKRMVAVLRLLRDDGYMIAVASNSIRDTIRIMLYHKGLLPFVDFFYSNEDVKNPKPNTEMYLRCMIKAGVNPNETVIVEDSPVGRKAAHASGAHLCAVLNPDDVTYEKIRGVIDLAENTTKETPKWNGGKMNVLIPMAGAGSRFEKAGYTFPKPLIDVNGKPMIQVVVDNLNIDAKHIFIVQKDHYLKYNLKETLENIAPGCEIVVADGMTEGAACTTLLARRLIDNNEPLIMANSDQVADWDSSEFMWAMNNEGVDGGILTFTGKHPKWSFAKIGEDGWITETAEKKPISDRATVGIYYWKRGSDYVKYADQMIEKDIRTNGEFYTCPVFNEAIADGKKIKEFRVEKMQGLGTPEDLESYLRKS